MPTRRSFLKSMGLSLSALAIWPLACTKAKRRPNIIYILADDLGYGDVSCLNKNSKLHTENIDKIGNSGVKFTDAHSGSAVCTPTRYGILTGRYAWRSRLKDGVLWGYSPTLIPPERKTVATLLKANGYKTGCVGKWHLGLDWTTTDGKKPSDRSDEPGENVDLTKPVTGGPNTVGFDYSFIIPASLDMFPYVYLENHKVTALPDRETVNTGQKFWRKGPTGADFEHEQVLPKLTEKAVEFVNQNADKPFFLYFPLPAPHTPILPTKEFIGKSNTTIYGDFVLQCDWTVGQVLNALDENGIAENTIIIFTSDNGCSPQARFDELEEFGHDPSYVFRGHKADIFEGGHRIPFLVRWPKAVNPKQENDTTICLTDLMATCADLVAEKLPDNAGEDSVSFLPLLLNEQRNTRGRDAIIHHSVNGDFSIRKGKWKLEMCPGSGGWSDPRPGSKNEEGLPPIQLYDVEKDVAETTNLQAEYPEVVKELTELLTEYVQNGTSTFGAPQKNDPPEHWKKLWWN